MSFKMRKFGLFGHIVILHILSFRMRETAEFLPLNVAIVFIDPDFF